MATSEIEYWRQYFVDPSVPESAADLRELSGEAIEVMAWIFASGGDISQMDTRISEWLVQSREAEPLRRVLGQVLEQETKTRRFDQRSMAQIHPQGSKVGILANLVAAYMNTNTIVKEVSRGEHRMEAEVVNWLCEMFGFDPEKGSGNIVTGGSMANQLALWVARDAKFVDLGVTETNDDVPLPRLTVLTNALRHYSIKKTCHQLQMRLVEIPALNYKTDVTSLRSMLQNMPADKLRRIAAVVAVAGETETGLVDNLEAIADICQEYGIHLHVDAAYGGPFILSRKGRLFRGIDRADSITVDPHKMMWTPYASGAVLFRDRRKHALVQVGPRYLTLSTNSGLTGPDSERNFGLAARPEGSMGSGGVISTWATIKLFGREGLTALLDHTLDVTEYAYERVARSGLLRARQPLELNEFLIGLNLSHDRVAQLSPARYKEIMNLAKVYADQVLGTYISLNQDIDEGRDAWRFIVVHPYTTEIEVEELMANLEQTVARLLNNDKQLEREIKAIIEREKGWI